ncbi:hypothetical protein ILYODFUR_023242 [Ilyodon furcidens]|uniref:Uncharacterized protein n=1 Tax=Ilyodon furcidens TaxID=33524 RepID=A0ABV0SNM0_9TELE
MNILPPSADVKSTHIPLSLPSHIINAKTRRRRFWLRLPSRAELHPDAATHQGPLWKKERCDVYPAIKNLKMKTTKIILPAGPASQCSLRGRGSNYSCLKPPQPWQQDGAGGGGGRRTPDRRLGLCSRERHRWAT